MRQKWASNVRRRTGTGTISILRSDGVGEAIEGIEHAGLREALIEAVAAWLEARG